MSHQLDLIRHKARLIMGFKSEHWWWDFALCRLGWHRMNGYEWPLVMGRRSWYVRRCACGKRRR